MPIAAHNRREGIELKIADLVRDRQTVQLLGDPDSAITGIEYDSRRVHKGDLFVALSGGYFDGHEFVGQARERGAAAVLVERNVAVDLPQIIVENTRSTLAVVASRFYREPSRELNVIGITGTDGKTTTSYLVEAILAHAGRRTGLIGTVGVRIGDRVLDSDTRQTTPESVDVQRHLRAMVDAGVAFAIVEATSHGLDLHRLDEIRFATGAVTNITHEHLDHHGTRAEYWRAKGILFERVGATVGNAIVNVDDAGAREMIQYAGPARVMTYSSEGHDADLRALDLDLDAKGSRFTVEHQGNSMRFETALVGRFNVANALCATGVALSHDISLEMCQTALSHSPAIPGRMQSIQLGQPFSVIVDYAHTPDSVEKVLKLLRQFTPGRLIVVMGSAGERDIEKRCLQGAVAARLADFSIFTTEDPRFENAESIIDQIAVGARGAGAIEAIDYCRIVDRREALEHALRIASAGDCVLLAGKGHERSIIWGLEKRPWDEASVATEILMSHGFGGDCQ
jgi:UDP-N-acetylmuramoyl-L-alanyl-D-glutamate--2,6-diaminopimelate ligase